MLVHKGGKIKNLGGECRDVTPTKLQSQNIFKESTGGGSVGERGVRMDVNKELKFLCVFFFWGGGGVREGKGGGWWGREGGGVRVDVNREVKFLRKLKKKIVGGGGGDQVGGCQVGCE